MNVLIIIVGYWHREMRHLDVANFLPQAQSLHGKAQSRPRCQELAKQQQWVQAPALHCMGKEGSKRWLACLHQTLQQHSKRSMLHGKEAEASPSSSLGTECTGRVLGHRIPEI